MISRRDFMRAILAAAADQGLSHEAAAQMMVTWNREISDFISGGATL